MEKYKIIEKNNKYGLKDENNNIVVDTIYNCIIDGDNKKYYIAKDDKNNLGFFDKVSPNIEFHLFEYKTEKLNTDKSEILYYSYYENEYVVCYIDGRNKEIIIHLLIIDNYVTLKIFQFHDKTIDPEIQSVIRTLIRKSQKRKKRK